jgi:hypothetical protein
MISFKKNPVHGYRGEKIFVPAQKRTVIMTRSLFTRTLGTMIIFLTFCALGATQQESGLVLWGLSRNDCVSLESFEKNKPITSQFDFADANLLTLNLRNANAESAKFEGSVDLWLLTGAYADTYRRLDSMSGLFAPQLSSVFIADVRKLYALLFLPFADVSIGRQIISFGQGMVFSPIDVFSSVNILDLSLRRRGSDVVRARVPFGDLSGVDAIAKLTAHTQDAAAAIKGYTHLAGFDCAGIGMYRAAQHEVITGITFKGDLAAGVYGELAEHWKKGEAQSFTGMLGADYSIENRWFFTAEYLYNEKPQNNDSASPQSFLQTIVPLLHHHYGFLMTRYKINDLMNISTSAITDISGKSGLFTLQYFDNILQNADIVIYMQYYRASSEGILPLPYDQATYGIRVEVAF